MHSLTVLEHDQIPLAGKHKDVTFQCIIRCCAIVLVLSKKIMDLLTLPTTRISKFIDSRIITINLKFHGENYGFLKGQLIF